MRKLSLIIGIICIMFNLYAQSPHGESLTLDCSDCHTTGNWEYAATARFLHSTTNFNLEGQHQFVDCRSCHTSLIFEETGINCNDCHTDMHNNMLGLDCARCHDSKSWIISNVTDLHQQSRFPLVGAHKNADCASCHLSSSLLEFRPLGIECVDCHRHDYEQTINPNHVQSNLSSDCSECHLISSSQWSASGFNHSFFPLTNGHALNDCAACHTNGLFENILSDCYSCHQSDFEASTNPSHISSNFSTNCLDCHTTDPDWQPAEYLEHDINLFPIYSGEHNGEWERCSECHTESSNFSAFSCIDCHEHNLSDMAEEHQGIGNYAYSSFACLACHPRGSSGEVFDHSTTAFPLQGQHLNTTCLDCHTQGFGNLSSACSDCHIVNYNQAQEPKHIEAGISLLCEDCHDENAWNPSSFNHGLTSNFELDGGHAGRQCTECHIGNTTDAVSDCYSCHSENYNNATDHFTLAFDHDCLQCHNNVDWNDASFDHNTTNFPLTGAHMATECNSCHSTGYAGTYSECSSCHLDNYNQAANPSHTDAGISSSCEDCHGTISWVPSEFSHIISTGFELNGGHAGRQCSDCHLGTTANASPDCYSCHNENYNSAPDHLALSFPHDCLQCHNNVDWNDASFDHSTTNFPLTGAHMATECNSCHSTGYAGTYSECSSCHLDNYNQAANPSHTDAGISSSCEDCHGTISWVPSEFSHIISTGFELNGGHAGRQCSDCHLGTTANASPDCYSCHNENYNSAPDHLALSFPHDCLQCHNNVDWNDASFDHSTTNFPLTGAHVATECISCHSDGYAGTSSECSSCHQSDFDQTTNPNHSSLGLSPSCDDCHSTNAGWNPALFPDHNNYYALNGAHASIAGNCFLCHSGNYVTTPNTCYACHTNEYNNTTDPAHSAAGFPTECATCHTENAWEPATFDHDGQYFPIYSGEHRGEWNSCSDCHTVTNVYSQFSCIDCHEHNKTDMDDEHGDVSGYTWESISCLSCHPTGEAE